MRLDVIALPALSLPEQIQNRAVVVFDVLRATTTITAALAAGVREIHIFSSVDQARDARRQYPQTLLCGEANCLPPDGFDLGNSPRCFNPDLHRDRTLLLATTNGTRAILAGRDARVLLVGALINAAAVGGRLRRLGLDVTLLCAGTNGQIAAEDLIGAGAVINALQTSDSLTFTSDCPQIALSLFRQARHDLPGALSATQGGQNVIRAGLPEDISFAARLDVTSCVGKLQVQPGGCVVRSREIDRSEIES